MAIKRYFSNKDNTITNAYKQDLATRGTGSNMGEADVLEVFSVYGQTFTSASHNATLYSTELSRALIQFPVSGTAAGEIKADRLAGTIPDSGSVKFFLRLFNAKHGQTVPEQAIFNILAVSSSWREGRGLDMDEYIDKDSSNWIDAKNISSWTAATATIKVISADPADYESGGVTAFTLVSADGTTRTYQFANGGALANGAVVSGTTIRVQVSGDSTQGEIAAKIKDAIENSNGHGTAKLICALSTVSQTNDTITITQVTIGTDGNTTIPAVANGNTGDLTINGGIVETSFFGGSGTWTSPGGDYHTSLYVPDTTMPLYTTSLTTADQDIEVDVTSTIEEWITGTKENYGFGIFLTASHEAYFSSSSGLNSGSVLHNIEGATKSYFTKKFFGRGTEFFFKKPTIEARWDSSIKDDRGNFYLSNSLAPASDNVNSLYMYNFVRGQLQDIGGNSSTVPTLKLYGGTSAVPDNSITLQMKHTSTDALVSSVQANRIEKGIYSASFAITSSSDTGYLWDVWEVAGTQAHTGSVIIPKIYGSSDYNPYTNCITKITNLKSAYSTDEKAARFKLFVRLKDWLPNNYTVASGDIENLIIENAFYKLFRVYDNEEIIAYGTGSDSYTRMSHDVSGNYFDLDISLLESDRMYGLKFIYKINDTYKEQKQIFKFRVE